MIHIINIEYSPIPQKIFRSFRTLTLTECTRGIKQGSIKGGRTFEAWFNWNSPELAEQKDTEELALLGVLSTLNE